MQDVDKFDPRKVLSPPIVGGNQSFGTVTDAIADISFQDAKKTPWWWVIGFAISFAVAQLLLITVAYLVTTGIGIWGNNVPVGWAFDIINFVWWIGIGHAGTLISAILLLMRQQWRTSINRFAEAMTLFAVACAFAHRPSMACLLDVALSEYDGDVATVPKPFDLGRFRGFNISFGFGNVLVCRVDS
jgi:hypothetical protein